MFEPLKDLNACNEIQVKDSLLGVPIQSIF